MRTRALTAVLVGVLILLFTGCGAFGKVDYLRVWNRDGWQHPQQVVRSVAVRPGSTVADLGSGDGYFLRHLSRAVGSEGRVFAVEVEDEKVAALEAVVAEQELANVTVVKGDLDDPHLPDGAIDVVLLVNVYHHLENRVPYFRGLQRDLVPGSGRVATIDIRDSGVATWVVPDGHWTSHAELKQEMTEAGYERVASHDYLPMQSFEIFVPAGKQ